MPKLAANLSMMFNEVDFLDRFAAAAEAEALAAIGGRLVALTEPDYPAALAAISDPPPVISVLGHGHVMNRDTVAIVGARNASAVGGRPLSGTT